MRDHASDLADQHDTQDASMIFCHQCYWHNIQILPLIFHSSQQIITVPEATRRLPRLIDYRLLDSGAQAEDNLRLACIPSAYTYVRAK